MQYVLLFALQTVYEDPKYVYTVRVSEFPSNICKTLELRRRKIFCMFHFQQITMSKCSVSQQLTEFEILK